MKKTALVPFLALLAACGGGRAQKATAEPSSFKGPRPEWVDGPSMEYNREEYITGVGLADDRQTAEDRARGEIAKIFNTVVNVTTSQTESENTATGVENHFRQSIEQNVQTAAKKALEGVEVVEKWQDQATRQHYALAVLERSKAAAAVRDRLQDVDKQSVDWKKRLDDSMGKLERVKAAMKLLALIKGREELEADLRVINGGKAEDGPLDEAAVKAQAAKAVSELDVAVDMSGEASQQIETAIVSGLTDFGLQAKKGGEGDVAVEGLVKTEAQRAAEGDKWKWARATVTVSLKERAGKTFARFDLTSRQASADQSEANRRAHVDLAKKVSAGVKDAVTAYFENQ